MTTLAKDCPIRTPNPETIPERRETWAQADFEGRARCVISELIEEQVRILTESRRSWDPQAKRLSVFHKAGSERHNENGGVIGIKQCLTLDNEHWSCFTRFRASGRVEIG
jgi:hypothetical protein